MNATLQVCKGISVKTNKTYYYISVVVLDREIKRIFISETEVPYYRDLFK